ncbi:MAG: homoserine dehydrogenase [Saprospiraceae bacterium]|nr:homoserine dehydrogenase [Saprospiraceae bacterium]
MSNQKKMNIGLFGYGVVVSAVYEVLNHTPSLMASIAKICIKNPNKPRNIGSEVFTANRRELLDDPAINVIVEMTDDAVAAFEIVKESLQNGKAVVTANKKMVANHLPELISLQSLHNTPLLYESACCASIPVIRNLEEYYDNDLLHGVEGIINGSTNYILSKIFNENLSYPEALKQAQELGFAESDPSLDVEGHDALNKLCLLLAHAYGVIAHPSTLVCHGIHRLNAIDREVASAQGAQIKLVARAVKQPNGEVAAFVLPQFVKPPHLLHTVRNEYNGVVLTSALADEQFFYGKGAGGFPTASAILADLSALRYDYKYEYKKLFLQEPSVLATDVKLNAYVSFQDWQMLPIDAFEEIHEYYSGKSFHYRKGVVSLKKLKASDWWKQPGVSLILQDEAILKEQRK